MPTFTYTARSSNGELKTATIDAQSKEDVVAQLRRQPAGVRRAELPMRTRPLEKLANAIEPLHQTGRLGPAQEDGGPRQPLRRPADAGGGFRPGKN